MKALILAAGLATRLRPFSLKRPKALFPIVNTALIDLIIARIREAGIHEIAINLHYLAPQITDHVNKKWPQIRFKFYIEPKLLWAGGSIAACRPWLEDQDLLIVNADIVSSIDFSPVIAYHNQQSDHVATMVVKTMTAQERGHFANIETHDGRIVKIDRSKNDCGPSSQLFAGVYILSKSAIDHLPKSGRACVVNDCFLPLLSNDCKLATYDHNGYWNDIGSPKLFISCTFDMLRDKELAKQVGLNFSLQDNRPGNVFISKHVNIGNNVVIEGDCVISDAVKVSRGTHIVNSVILPGATITHNCVDGLYD